MSLNEIELTTRRAARGAGLSFGLAEDAGRAAAWLAEAGLDFGVAVADALDDVATGCGATGEPATCPCWAAGVAEAATQCRSVFCVGPSCFDGLCVSAEPGAAELGRIDVPLLLLAMAAVRAAEQALDFELTWAVGEAEVLARCQNGQVTVTAPDLGTVTGSRGARVSVARLSGQARSSDDRMPLFGPEDMVRARRAALVDGVGFAAETVERIQRHAHGALVPSSPVSRNTGAGAGLVDSD